MKLVEGLVEFRELWLSLMDPGTLVLFVIPLLVISLGSHLSVQFYRHGGAVAREIAEEQDGIVSKYAIALPILGSLALILLFFFLDLIYYIFLLLLMFSSLTSVSYVAGGVFSAILSRLRTRRACRWIPLDIPLCQCIGRVSLSYLLSLVTAVALIVAFFLTNSIYISDSMPLTFLLVFALCIGVFALSVLRVPNLKVSLALLWAFFVYDVFWVFISPYIFGKNVMYAAVAVHLSAWLGHRQECIEHWNLPILIQVPRLLSDGPTILGMGDIVLPGLFLSFLYRYDMESCGSVCHGYYLNGCIGYVVGMIMTVTMLQVLQMAQPALLYLVHDLHSHTTATHLPMWTVPGTMFPTFVLAYSRGEFSNLLNGTPSKPLYIMPEGEDSVHDEEHGGEQAQEHLIGEHVEREDEQDDMPRATIQLDD